MFGGLFTPRAQAPGQSAQPQQQSGFSKILDPTVALPMAAALMGGQGNARNFSNAFAAAAPGLQQQAAQRQEAQRRNQTVEFLRQKSPELAQALDNGMPVGEAWKSYQETLKAQKPKDLINAGRGRLYDPNSKEWLTAPDMGTDAPTVKQFYDEKTGQPYMAQWNQNEGTWERTGGTKAPSGMSLKTNADGTVEFVQGSGAGQKLTEGQGKDIGFYTRGIDANAQLGGLESELTDWSQQNADRIPMGLGNYVRSPEFRQAKQAADSFLTAVLRKDTGAAITDQEFQIYGPMFLPVPGDDQQTIQQKRRAREVALLAIKSGLGTAEAIGEANRIALGVEGGSLTPQPNSQNMPAQGTIEDGYMFMGGDPTNPNSWQKVQ